MPSEVTPRMRAVFTERPPGSVAPGAATAVLSPATALGAPQTMESARSGSRTRQSLLRCPGDVSPRSRSIASIWPTTTPESPSATGVTEAPSIPALMRRSAISRGGRSVSTNSRSQRYEIFIAPRARSSGGCERRASSRHGPELLEKAQVVLVEQPDVVDLVLQNGDALDAHAEGPARHLFRIVADVAQHVGMHHAGAEDLEPAALLAEATPVAAALEARHVGLRGRLGEREEGRPEAQARAGPEHLTREQLERRLEVGHGHPAIDRQPLDLVEHR